MIEIEKCDVIELTKKESVGFLNDFEIKKSLFRLALISDSKIISVMVFSHPIHNKTYQFQLLKLHSELISETENQVCYLKLFEYFLKKYKPNSIISYSKECDFKIYDVLKFKILRTIKENNSNEKYEKIYIWNNYEKFGYIYLITDTLHSKQYVGQHRGYKVDENYYGSGKLIKSLIRKYGTNILKREIIDHASSQEELSQKEIEYIKRYNTLYPNGYNMTLRIQGIDAYIPHETPNELKQKRSKNAKALWNDKTYRDKISKSRKEMWENNKHRKAVSDFMKKRMSNPDEKQKLIKGLQKFLSDENNKKEWNEKRTKATSTEEYKRKLSEAAKGKKWFNNGKISVLRYEIPDGNEWIPGRLYKNKQF